jgi:biopolymer transport protein ExbD
MGMSSGGGSRAVPYINVTPLIDVLLVLLIIFMVITPLKPSRFQANVPTQRDPNEDLSRLKPNPLTLVLSITSDLKLKLNNKDAPETGEPCFQVVNGYGSVNDTANLSKCLAYTFQKRTQEHAYKPGMETASANVKDEDRIEKTVFVKAPRSLAYGEVVKVIDAIKGAGANPVGLQVDDLPQ